MTDPIFDDFPMLAAAASPSPPFYWTGTVADIRRPNDPAHKRLIGVLCKNQRCATWKCDTDNGEDWRYAVDYVAPGDEVKIWLTGAASTSHLDEPTAKFAPFALQPVVTQAAWKQREAAAKAATATPATPRAAPWATSIKINCTAANHTKLYNQYIRSRSELTWGDWCGVWYENMAAQWPEETHRMKKSEL